MSCYCNSEMCPKCGDPHFDERKYVYYDYMDDEFCLDIKNPTEFEPHYGDYCLIYLGEL